MAYRRLDRLVDWHDDRTLVIDVSRDGTAVIRDLTKQYTLNNWKAVPEAVAEAERMIGDGLWHRDFVVHLHDGATWDETWGPLG